MIQKYQYHSYDRGYQRLMWTTGKTKQSDVMGKVNHLLQENHWSKDPYRCVYFDLFRLRGPQRHEKSHWGDNIHGTLSVAKKVLVKRLDTKSSTQAELVCVIEYLPYNLQVIIFLHCKGYGIINNLVYQDNQSAIRMDKNGRNYCTGNSIHINIRYF